MVIEEAEVRFNGQLASGIFTMDLAAPVIAASAKPGQFVNVLIDEHWSPLLRRPMSVAACQDDQIKLIYKIFGAGTRTMTTWTPGDKVNLLGPLGNGWDIIDKVLPVLVGGGVGIAPINFLHQVFEQRGVQHLLLMGARNEAEHYLQHAPEERIFLTTDDGSAGIQGTVLKGLEIVLDQSQGEQITIYGCGPRAMLKALKSFADTNELPCQLATEELMACGFGLCQGCNVEVKTSLPLSQPSYRERYKLACVDGPVFWAHQLAEPT